MFPWDLVDGLWATKNEGFGLIIVRAISFQDFQSAYVLLINQRLRQTDRLTDRRHAIAIPRFAL